MKKLLNTLYITTPRTYLSLDGENIIATKKINLCRGFPYITLKGLLDLVLQA